MSDHTEPRPRGPYSIASAIIGARLNLQPQRGDEHAKLIWLVILSRTPWDGIGPTWANDETLAHDAGIDQRDVRRALARLRGADMLSTPTGHRPGARRPHGRLLVPRLGSPVKVVIPDREDIARIWLTCRSIRKRPAALVTLAVGLHFLACHAVGRRPWSRSRIPGTMADARRLVGARKGHAWTARLRDLERLGIIVRVNGDRWLAPASEWRQVEDRRVDVAVDHRWDAADRSWP